MNFSIVTCLNYNKAIGWKNTNSLIFYIFGYLCYVRELTKHTYNNKKNIIVMGRKTWDSLSLYNQFEGKYICVITSNYIKLNEKYKDKENFQCFPDIEQFLYFANSNNDLFNNTFVMGGKSIYEDFLQRDLIKTIYLTEIETQNHLGDVFFPISYIDNFNDKKSISYKNIMALNNLENTIINLDYSRKIYERR
jgi:dihydrofolate reductase/thymidylate synthase